MAKFDKFIGTQTISFTKGEIAEFMSRFSVLVEKYDKSLLLNYSSDVPNHLAFTFKGEMRKFRNKHGDRIAYTGVIFVVDKKKGFLDNKDWINDCPIDASKPIRDYEGAPAFQYSASCLVLGTKIPYRHLKSDLIKPEGIYQYGTELDDIDFTPAIRELYEDILVARE